MAHRTTTPNRATVLRPASVVALEFSLEILILITSQLRSWSAAIFQCGWECAVLRSIAETQEERRIAQDVHGRDEGDRASRSHEKELLSHRNAQLRNVLRGIESALGRIEDGTFGECINCAQEINTKRLEALPW